MLIFSSNLLDQPRGTGNVEAEIVDARGGNLNQEIKESGGGTAEAKNGSDGDTEGEAIPSVPT